MVVVPARLSDEIDRTLMARLKEARDRYSLEPTPENYEAHHRAFRQFADWVLRGQLPDDSAVRPRSDLD
jgi:hypothetical protein